MRPAEAGELQLLGYAFRRLLTLVPIMLGIAIVTFVLLQLIPGNSSDLLLPPDTPGAVRIAFEKSYHLNDPIYSRFVAWLWHAVRGQFGTSIQTGQSAISVTLTALGNTAQLALAGAIISTLLGTLVGLMAAWWANSWFDRIVRLLVVAAASMPTFWVGLILVYLLAIKSHVFPTGGLGPLVGNTDLGTRLRYMTLPAFTVAILPGAIITRMCRALFLDVKSQEFVLALRTRGYSTLRIWRHIVRNAAPGVVNICGLQLGYLVLGTLFVEVVFSWPGIGVQIQQAISYRDYPVIEAIILLTGVSFATITMITDILLRGLDPRVEGN